MTYWGGIEAGGTKFMGGVCGEDGRVIERQMFPTGVPDTTIPQVVAYFQSLATRYPLSGIGLASFGPLDLNPSSTTFGAITSTPKTAWQNFPIRKELASRLGAGIAVDTDVNAAVLAESIWGAAVGLENAVYLTIGTGIGGGLLVNGRLVHGLLHPEIGHMRIRTREDGVSFRGVCAFHNYCLEGLASGPAIQERWGQPAESLPPDHPAWTLEAEYLAEGIVNLILTVSPQRVILGGGVMQQEQLFPTIRNYVSGLLNGYIQHETILKGMDSYIIPPKLGKDVGLLGAAALAMRQAGAV
ncbi:ROK family protein [bacterium]|nr:ROK family protein [bacterium]